jgi:hypothetical protein
MTRWLEHFVLDVEADGPCPGLYNMISFGIVSVLNPKTSFLGEVAPILSHAGIESARAISAISFETQKTYRDPGEVMAEARDWLMAISAGKRAVFWSDNPAFDWQYWNFYCHKYLGENPAGFSARRIGDLDAGRRQRPLTTNAWTKWRDTPHTHNPIDDARGNAEGLRWVLTMMGENFDG